MKRWKGKIAVVTGASAGIGLATSKALVNEGLIVVGLARRKDNMLNEMKNIKGPGEFHAFKCDITKKDNVIEAFEYVKNTFKKLHVLINNAGVLTLTTFVDAKIEELEQIINVNLMGLIYCSKLAIKLMKENDDEAYIVNINSIAGHLNRYEYIKKQKGLKISRNIYPITKCAVTALSDIFTEELECYKIRVTNISPGCVNTEMTEKALAEAGLSKYQRVLPHLLPEDISDSILHVLASPSRLQITELTIKPFGEKHD